jgi:hypothetical protein
MDIPTVVLSGTNVIIDWTAPTSHSSTIIAYDIEFRTRYGTYVADLTDCNGALSSIVTATTCTVPMSTIVTLTSRSVDYLIKVKVRA